MISYRKQAEYFFFFSSYWICLFFRCSSAIHIWYFYCLFYWFLFIILPYVFYLSCFIVCKRFYDAVWRRCINKVVRQDWLGRPVQVCWEPPGADDQPGRVHLRVGQRHLQVKGFALGGVSASPGQPPGVDVVKDVELRGKQGKWKEGRTSSSQHSCNWLVSLLIDILIIAFKL